MSRVTQSMYKTLYFENDQLRKENTKLRAVVDLLKTHIADGEKVINRGIELMDDIGDWEGCRGWLEYNGVIEKSIDEVLGEK